ncbi:SDR family NAD(P)-dependent oxidoreductase [Streptomyces sp. NBC_01239]|uniref:SDR family NAD(P)-dependent oxidoreductase n=1 Tax=Streptomyces sp. NBC_01239 TaxID=2903792 RepID=UPI002256185D|nr:SDR family NAD(P)-dependent oxidoreductase [Streptomyces sp. NBC_01239]MCX4815189.1 SDR family NAD(P)-dependent oxidoreductase [Streptomyces sp. NBC_01239]
MAELRFEGRVAVVTGAGRGIGRAHARLLAERGAKVVVNDLGGSMEGDGVDVGPAQQAVDSIVAAGGEAVADHNDVSTEAGGKAIVDTALNAFGRIDIVVNNAGIIRYAGLPEVDLDNLERHLAVHLLGSFNTTRAAWPHFVEQGYGRVVLTTSAGLFGLDNNLSYAAAKGGVIGLARSAKLSGEPHGIKVNVIAPAALTRMAGIEDEAAAEEAARQAGMQSEAVSPIVAYLAHEDCPVSGEIYAAGAGAFARFFIGSTPGYVQQGAPATVEDVVRNWDAINDEKGYYVPSDLMAWTGEFLGHQFKEKPGSAAS